MFFGTSLGLEIDGFDLWMDFHGSIAAEGSELDNSWTNSVNMVRIISSELLDEGQFIFKVSLVE